MAPNIKEILLNLRTVVEQEIKHEGDLCAKAAMEECICMFGSRNGAFKEIINLINKELGNFDGTS